MIIEQSEIVVTLPLDNHYSVNNIPDSTIIKEELLLANDFLGETFYNEILATKTSTGVFSNTDYQTFYDNYLKTLISESVLLSVITQNVLNLSNKSLEETGSTQLDALTTYRTHLAAEIVKSKLLVESHCTSSSNASKYQNFLGNNSNSTTTEGTTDNTFAGFNFD